MIKLLTINETCGALRWGETTFYTRRAAGLFPKPINIAGSKKSNAYFEHEIEYYITHAIHISSEDEFRNLAREIESNRYNLAA